jgi:hypothetical protein
MDIAYSAHLWQDRRGRRNRGSHLSSLFTIAASFIKPGQRTHSVPHIILKLLPLTDAQPTFGGGIATGV